MTAHEVFEMYIAVKLHFTTTSYDYFKYNGKTKASLDKRTDRYFFEYIAANQVTTKEDFLNKLLVFIHLHRKFHVKELVEWLRHLKDDEYYWKFIDFYSDPLRILDRDLSAMNWNSKYRNDPMFFFKYYINKSILIETFLLICKVIPVLQQMSKQYNPLFEEEMKFLKKYMPFAKFHTLSKAQLKESLMLIKRYANATS